MEKEKPLEEYTKDELISLVRKLKWSISTHDTEVLSLKNELKKTRNQLYNKILVVEDGSVDVDQLKADGYQVIVYRQGAPKPEFIKEVK